MDDNADVNFDVADAGASETYPVTAGNLKKSSFVMLNGRPCRVVELTTSKTGKHGHAKANITGIDIFTGQKNKDICPTSHSLNAPFVNRSSLRVLDISDEHYVTLLDEKGDIRSDLQLPTTSEGTLDAVGQKVQESFQAGKIMDVVILKACNTEKIVEVKVSDT